jgi:hypothetical protein
MFSLFSAFGQTRPAKERVEWALRQPEARSFAPRPARPQRAADDRLYFAARSLAANGFRHILQYAFVDDRGNVVMSVVADAPSPVLVAGHEPPDAMPVEPMAPEALEYMLSRICNGANIVTFGRVLQTGMLPREALDSAASVDCAWRRYLKLTRQRQPAFNRHEPLNLSDALSAAGLKPPESEDAVMRALAVRDLWMWMDRAELRRGLA